MQIRCTFYGLRNASSGIEYPIERDLLAVGKQFHCNDQDYVILSVGERQGQWFANVTPAIWRQPLRPPRMLRRTTNGTPQPRVQTAQPHLTPKTTPNGSLHETPAQVGEWLDRLIQLLERLAQDAPDPDC